MKKSFRALFLILVLVVMLSGCINTAIPDKNTLIIKKLGNGSSGKYWDYTIDKEGIIEEAEHKVSHSLGPGYTDIWTFKAVGYGEVTINWTGYVSGGTPMGIGCYSTTYTIDENGFHEKSITYKLIVRQQTKTSENKQWKYSMDTTEVFKETNYEIKNNERDIRIQTWNFDAIDEGEIIFTWNEYENDVLIEDSCYSVTYNVDKDGISQKYSN